MAHTVKSLLDIARQTITEAGCASLITVDESGNPSSRPVVAFAPDEDFSRIVVGTHPDSRKTVHVRKDSRVVLSYVDLKNRGYVTVIGRARLEDDAREKKAYWTEPFAAFWPEGPESEDYLLMVVAPERLEVRSFGLGVAEQPTRWSPVILERAAAGEWQQAD